MNAAAVTFIVETFPTFIRATATLSAGSTREDAQALASLFPKSVKVVASTTSFCDGRASVGHISFDVSLKATKTTGAVNEAGQRRYAAFLKHAVKLGFSIKHK